jgi:hypothetical protein
MIGFPYRKMGHTERNIHLMEGIIFCGVPGRIRVTGDPGIQGRGISGLLYLLINIIQHAYSAHKGDYEIRTSFKFIASILFTY